MKLDPRHLESLAVIVDLGTLRLAAIRLATSQPALSRLISNLEARVGLPLFERATRPLKPTTTGLELAQQGRAIRTARVRAEEMVRLGSQGFFGVLKIGAPPFLCKTLVSDSIASFLSERPNIRVDLISDYHAELMEKIYLNKVDIVVGPSKFVEQGNLDLNVDPIFDDANVIVGRRDHPLFSQASVTADHLRGVVWVGHSSRSILRSDMESALAVMGVPTPAIALQSDSAEAVLQLLRETDFLTFLPRYAIKSDGSDGLGVLGVSLPEQSQTINAITLAERTETKLVRDFKAHLMRNVGQTSGN